MLGYIEFFKIKSPSVGKTQIYISLRVAGEGWLYRNVSKQFRKKRNCPQNRKD